MDAGLFRLGSGVPERLDQLITEDRYGIHHRQRLEGQRKLYARSGNGNKPGVFHTRNLPRCA